MPTQPASLLPSHQPLPQPPRWGPPWLWWVALLLLFLLLAWGVWWFFEYKIQQLERQTNGMADPP